LEVDKIFLLFNPILLSGDIDMKSKAVSDALLKHCLEETKKYKRQGEIGTKLRAIASVREHGVTKTAQVYGVTRVTIMHWIKQFRERGVAGFKVKPGRGKKFKLAGLEEVMQALLEKESGITIDRMKAILEEQHGAKASRATVHKSMQRVGFSHIKPRPMHYKADPEAQETFKKSYKRPSRKK